MKWTTGLGGSTYNCQYPIGFNNYVMTWDALNAQLPGVAEQSADETSVYTAYKKIIEIRKKYNLANGVLVSNTTGGNLIDYTVKSGRHEIRILVNATGKALALPSGLAGTRIYGPAASSVPAGAMMIYEVK